jgi:Na+/proline symporter
MARVLIASVVLYLLLTIAIGLWAARRVHNSRDYVVAGRSVPLFMSTAFLTAALGSIPQQDVFQRVTAAKDAGTAVRGALLGGLIYFCMAFVPIYLAYCALLIDPSRAAARRRSEREPAHPAEPHRRPHAVVRTWASASCCGSCAWCS